jgi:exodeoxyribonuclease VII small subunit
MTEGKPIAAADPAAAGAAGSATDVSSLSFEEALAELEQIVGTLESGQQMLEDAIVAYERGVTLRRHCEAKLLEVEGRVAAIVEADGTVLRRPAD